MMNLEKENTEPIPLFNMKDTSPKTNVGKIKPKKNPRREAKNIMQGISKPVKPTESKEIRMCRILQEEYHCQCFLGKGQCKVVTKLKEIW